ncbi:MAG TPA: NrfD/PsrC family molybdoenzyme membrane anchor subunit [Acidimicrobiales bacterium]|nr:NrfD/PsrC family molybdoenzyme membrane anchor subunit [Acidimicrobiales bacterium]
MLTVERPTVPSPRDDGLVDAAVAPIIRHGRGSTMLMAALAVPVLAAVGAWVYQVSHGLSVTGLNSQVFWGVYEVDLVTFIGFSYGGALVSAILRLTGAHWRGPITRLAEGTAVVTLCVGAVFPIIHLGHPERLWEMFVRPNPTSPLLWDMVAIITYLLATLALFVLPLVPDVAAAAEQPDIGERRRRLYLRMAAGWLGTPEQRRVLDRALTVVAVGIVPLAVMVHTVLSYAFSLTSRPGWHSTIFGPYFVVAAVYSGVAIVILATAAYRRAYHLEAWIPALAIRYLGYLMVALAATYAYFLFTEVTTEGYVSERTTEGVLYVLLLKRYAPLFWTFVALGLVTPVLLVTIRRTVGAITAAAGLVVGALWLKRFLMFVPPLTQPLIGGSFGRYSPSWVEWTISVGAAAAVPLLLILLFRVLPVLSIDEMAHPEPPAGDVSARGLDDTEGVSR